MVEEGEGGGAVVEEGLYNSAGDALLFGNADRLVCCVR